MPRTGRQTHNVRGCPRKETIQTMRQHDSTPPAGHEAKGVTVEPGSPEWARYVSSSKVSAIMGCSKYASPVSVWHEMRGDVTREQSAASEAQARGTAMEPWVLDYNWLWRHPDWERKAGETTWTRDDMPWAIANTDSHGVDASGVPVIVEAKTVGYRSGLDEWGEEGTDEVPLAYYYQVLFQMLVSGIWQARVERLGPGIDEHKEYVIRYDEQLGEALRVKLATFYQSVIDGVPPEPDGHPETIVTYKKVHTGFDDTEWEVNPTTVGNLIFATTAEQDAQQRKREAQASILAALGDAKYATVGGVRVARRQRSGKGVALRLLVDTVPAVEPQADAA